MKKYIVEFCAEFTLEYEEQGVLFYVFPTLKQAKKYCKYLKENHPNYIYIELQIYEFVEKREFWSQGLLFKCHGRMTKKGMKETRTPLSIHNILEKVK